MLKMKTNTEKAHKKNEASRKKAAAAIQTKRIV